MSKIDIRLPLLECLKQFSGAPQEEKDYDARISALEDDFVLLAKKLLYGGYFLVKDNRGNDVYKIDIQTVEFYYHEETKADNGIFDPIVYHRNGRFPSNQDHQVPAFPLMALHTHQSGIDITFEEKDGKYRASALIRAFSVFDYRLNEYVKWDSKEKTDGIYHHRKDKPYVDARSQYLYYYINGFDINSGKSLIEWKPNKDVDYDSNPIYYGRRKNVFKDKEKKILCKRRWAFSKEALSFTHSNSEKEDFHPVI